MNSLKIFVASRRRTLCRVAVAATVRALPVLLLIALPGALEARQNAPAASVAVLVRTADGPLEGAQISAGGVGALTDPTGRATLRLPPGAHRIRVERIGFRTSETDVTLRSTADTTLTIELEVEAIEAEEILVVSTRGERRIEDEPLRVEVIAREEVEEKLLMTPGDIAMMLNETAGLRVQPTSPALGGASVRIQGLRGRYTQILSDGLPLYGGQTGALGPLQIPPMDLGQVEVIKGVASALYGASALGGVVNLISRRPPETSELEGLLNQSTLGGTDAILWSSRALSERWGYTLLASGHRQSAVDVDEDGWADVPRFGRGVLRPRLFWSDGEGRSLFVTAGGMVEDREGGTVRSGTTPDGAPFIEGQDTRRFDAGAVARLLLAERLLLSLRGSGVMQRHEHRYGDALERDRHWTAFTEAALSGSSGRHTWVVGAALQQEDYAARELPEFDYRFTVPGIFAQDEYAPSEWLTLSVSARVDRHSEYGTFLNPRLSALLRPDDGWSVRGSVGTGYFAPTPWTEETEAIGLGLLFPVMELEAERARSASVDVAHTRGPLELNATLFASRIQNAVQLRAIGDVRLGLVNAEEPVRTHGSELLARYHAGPLHVTATHVYVRSTETDPLGGARREVPLTPRHSAALVAAWEQEGQGRLGFELYYTGRQKLEENPYRDESVPYVSVGFLVERRLGPVRAFLNAENVFDARQTRHERLVLPARAPDGRWITDVWAPLEGRSFNAGVRWEL